MIEFHFCFECKDTGEPTYRRNTDLVSVYDKRRKGEKKSTKIDLFGACLSDQS
jgi:hypothetical protein